MSALKRYRLSSEEDSLASLPKPASCSRELPHLDYPSSLSVDDFSKVEGCSKESLALKLRPLQLDAAVEHTSGKSISETINTMASKFPKENEQRDYTDRHPLSTMVRFLMQARDVGCPLCSYFEWNGLIQAHELERCHYRDESKVARLWLGMFEKYAAKDDFEVATCDCCYFPQTLCWRHVYFTDMNHKYGNELKALMNFGVHYRQVQCDWVRVAQRCVAAAMVAGASDLVGVSEMGRNILESMGWTDWKFWEVGKDEKDWFGRMQEWLQEKDDIHGLQCPRLLKLFWIVVMCTSDKKQLQVLTDLAMPKKLGLAPARVEH